MKIYTILFNIFESFIIKKENLHSVSLKVVLRQQRMRWLGGITDSTLTHEFEQTQRDSKGQGSLVCCSSWSHKELDTT